MIFVCQVKWRLGHGPEHRRVGTCQALNVDRHRREEVGSQGARGRTTGQFVHTAEFDEFTREVDTGETEALTLRDELEFFVAEASRHKVLRRAGTSSGRRER